MASAVKVLRDLVPSPGDPRRVDRHGRAGVAGRRGREDHRAVLITHGENDRQIPLEYARACYDEAVNRPQRELKIFTAADGGVEHIGIDNLKLFGDYIADWIEETWQRP
ncbi:hypothetical protein [Glycomyces rhizosphaerae]|uniref:hypothetical protein n=1 Tax=Glycomyces rhizosphaerae TaxID=2054422 RepID=UPI0036DCAAD9